MNTLNVLILAFAYFIVVIIVNRNRGVAARIVDLDRPGGFP